jgi:hypothetical protein
MSLNLEYMNFPELMRHRVYRNAPLPIGEPIEKLATEAAVAK